MAITQVLKYLLNDIFREKSSYMHQKMVNSCSQTEDYKKHLGFEQPIVQSDRHYIVAQSDVYKQSSTKSPDKGKILTLFKKYK